MICAQYGEAFSEPWNLRSARSCLALSLICIDKILGLSLYSLESIFLSGVVISKIQIRSDFRYLPSPSRQGGPKVVILGFSTAFYGNLWWF